MRGALIVLVVLQIVPEPLVVMPEIAANQLPGVLHEHDVRRQRNGEFRGPRTKLFRPSSRKWLSGVARLNPVQGGQAERTEMC